MRNRRAKMVHTVRPALPCCVSLLNHCSHIILVFLLRSIQNCHLECCWFAGSFDQRSNRIANHLSKARIGCIVFTRNQITRITRHRPKVEFDTIPPDRIRRPLFVFQSSQRILGHSSVCETANENKKATDYIGWFCESEIGSNETTVKHSKMDTRRFRSLLAFTHECSTRHGRGQARSRRTNGCCDISSLYSRECVRAEFRTTVGPTIVSHRRMGCRFFEIHAIAAQCSLVR